MKYFGNDLSLKHKELSRIIRREGEIDMVKKLALEIHDATHRGRVSDSAENETDSIFCDLKDSEYSVIPTSKDDTLCWEVWHMARIEDLTMSILFGNTSQVFNEEYARKMNVSFTDTGNAMTVEQVMKLSKEMNIEQMLLYRDDVGRKTRDLIRSFPAENMREKVSSNRLDEILHVGGIVNDEKSIWLLDYWSGKDMAGLILMPATRHNILHINDCGRLKEQIRTRKKFYRT